MKINLINLIDQQELREKNWALVDSELNHLGEAKLIELFKEFIAANSIEANARVLGLAQIINASLVSKKFALTPGSRLAFVIWADFLFSPLTLFKIPLQYWSAEAHAACELILKFIESDSADFRAMPEFDIYYELRRAAEARLAQDPQFKANFEKYSHEIGTA